MLSYFNIRNLVRVHILDPAALATSSQALNVFLAVWRRGAGHVTNLRNADIVHALYKCYGTASDPVVHHECG